MANRERKRTERRKRKQRRPEGGPASKQEFVENYRARSEARNREAREALEPLYEGQRPLVVTLGAIVAAALAAFNVVAWAAGLDLQGKNVSIVQVLGPVLLMGAAAWGMWRARYWAVLGFQVILAILVLGGSIGLVQATSVKQGVASVAVMAVAGAFFWFMVKALARIQMPDRLPRG